MKTTLTLYRLILILFVLGLLGLSVWPIPTQADNPLPPREPPTPDQPQKEEQRDKGDLAGAYIELLAADASAGGWAVVQWQDSAGGWQNVEGWQGTIKDSSRWWVHPKDFGNGPFRWVITQGKGGAVLGSSQPFKLPIWANQTVQVSVSLAKK